eukprot:gene5970-6574_t
MLAEALRGDRSKLYDRVSNHQRYAGILSLITAGIAFVLITSWMNGSDLDAKYLGGLNTDELLFNYHPLFMTLGLFFCGLSSMLSYRIINLPKLTFTKPLHAFLHSAALIFIFLGLYAVFKGNDDTRKNSYHAFYANLLSIHSFIGLGAVCLYGLNYVLGLGSFLLGCASDDMKRAYMPYHVFVGFFSLLMIFMAVETGIMDLFREQGCDVEVDSADLNPAANYHKLPEGCRVGNAAGIFVLVTAFLAVFALYDFRTKTDDKTEDFNYLLAEESGRG